MTAYFEGLEGMRTLAFGVVRWCLVFHDS
jgi:hypothetical protein